MPSSRSSLFGGGHSQGLGVCLGREDRPCSCRLKVQNLLEIRLQNEGQKDVLRCYGWVLRVGHSGLEIQGLGVERGGEERGRRSGGNLPPLRSSLFEGGDSQGLGSECLGRADRAWA